MRSAGFLVVSGLLAFSPFSWGQHVFDLINFSETGQLGISVKLGDNTRSFPYILDTGSAGFFTAKGTTSAWDDTILSPGTEAFHVSYGTGGLAYTGTMGHTKVTFQTSGGSSLTVHDVRLGVIHTVEGRPNWDANINHVNGEGHPDPIAPETETSHQFFGTFGAGLFKTATEGGNASSVIGQIPLAEGLTKGFVIHTGGRESSSAKLTVGLTQEMMASFPILIQMNPSTGVQTNSNGTTVNLYPEAQASATYTIVKGDLSYQTVAQLILDTGGLGTHITTGSEIDPPAGLLAEGGESLIDGASFSVDIEGTDYPGTETAAGDLDWTIAPTGPVLFENKVGVVTPTDPLQGSLNSGIALFYQYDVMFDTENGLIGLRPVPEPGAFGLLGTALAALGILRVRRKREG